MKRSYFPAILILLIMFTLLFSWVPITIADNLSDPLSEGLVAYYKFDTGSGDIAYDSSGNGNDGAIVGATWTVGISGHALIFDGDKDYVSIPRVVQDDFSITVWVKTTQKGVDHQEVGQWHDGFGIIDGEVGGITNDFGLSICNGLAAFGTGNPDTTIYSTSSLNLDSWIKRITTRSKDYKGQ